MPVSGRAYKEKRINNMDDQKVHSSDEQEFLRALDKSSETNTIESGDILKGKVLQIDDSYVYVDVGYKSEGKIPHTEFEIMPNAGDEIDVLVTNREDASGQIIMSKTAADRIKSSAEIEIAWRDGLPLKGLVKATVKGGFTISIRGTAAFCPFSHIDIRPSKNESKYIGNEYDFRIIKKTNRDIVVSRKIILEEQRNYTVKNFLDSLKEGDIIKGKVKNIEKFGAFVEIVEGLDGFLAIPNMGWERVSDPKKIIAKDEERMFKVLSIDLEKQKVDLGIKQLEDDPWARFIEQYKVGDVVEGSVESIKQFGAFIKIYSGVEGLAHISDMSWNTHVKNPSEFVKVGDFVECKILEINTENRKVGLGLKQVKENPWNKVEKEFPSKQIVSCKVKRILRNFAVFELPNGLEGICDGSDFDWRNNVVNINNFVKEDDTVDMCVISVDKDKQRIRLSYKHTQENPWKNFEKKHPVGSIINGTVKAIVDSGVVVTLPDEMEGFAHVSQLDVPKGTNIDSVMKVGEEYPFVMREVNHIKNRISLSRRDYLEAQAKSEIKNYITSENASSMTFNFFDDLNEKDK